MIRKSLVRTALALIVAGVLAACSNLGLNAADDQAVRKAYEQIRSGDRAGLAKWAGPELKAVDDQTWEAMRALIPQQAPTSVAVTSWKYNMGTSGNVLETVHTYDYADRTVRAETVLQRPGPKGPWTVMGFHVKAEAKTASSDVTAV